MLCAALTIALLQDIPVPLEVHYKSHDGHEMFGKLYSPKGTGPFPVVIYVQTAEGMTVDMKRPLGASKTFNYFDLYRKKLPEAGIAFFSYEGRGIEMGDSAPRYEKIDRSVYDTSTLDNKVLDVISAISVMLRQKNIDPKRIYLIGASEGTLIAAQAAAALPTLVSGVAMYGVMSSNMRYTFDYIMTDGAYLVYRQAFDANKDGVVSKEEFESDPAKYRATALRGAEFGAFDKNGDGSFTLEEMRELTKPLTDAIKDENFEVLDAWAAASAAVATPKGWFKDHFAQKPMWTYLSQITAPVGLFHGDLDTSVPIEGTKLLESKAKAAGKSNLEFHYFSGVGHSLGVERYFVDGTVPGGHQAIFEFFVRISKGSAR